MSDNLFQRAKNINDQSYKAFIKEAKELNEMLCQLEPKMRIRFDDELKEYLLWLQDHKCSICQNDIASNNSQVDHIIPFSLGGGHETANVQMLCSPCNRKKTNHVDPTDLIIYLKGKLNNLNGRGHIVYLNTFKKNKGL